MKMRELSPVEEALPKESPSRSRMEIRARNADRKGRDSSSGPRPWPTKPRGKGLHGLAGQGGLPLEDPEAAPPEKNALVLRHPEILHDAPGPYKALVDQYIQTAKNHPALLEGGNTEGVSDLYV